MNEIALTILEQLGGGRFLAMTGARNLVAGNDQSLTFGLPRFPEVKVNRVKITLNDSDTYDIQFMRWSGRTMQLTTLAEAKDVYCDVLREVFTEHTGLDCTL